jgi:hypothetical protein
MSVKQEFPSLRNRSYIRPLPVLSAVAIFIAGGAFLTFPDGSNSPDVATATVNGPQTTADESLCENQAWPYIDQRCAQRVEETRGTRQVRVVTDKGNSVTIVTPVPTEEAKPKPLPQTAVVAQADRQIGPPAAPAAPESAPQTEKVAAAREAPVAALSTGDAAEPGPTVQAAVAPAVPAFFSTDEFEHTSAQPAADSTETVATSDDAIEQARPKKTKAARVAEKREAKRDKPAGDGSVPADVVAAVRALPTVGESGRRARKPVPDEVVAAVEQATARESSRRIVTFGSQRGGERLSVVPGDRW